ncbi:MAG: hydantoinase/oxoprolinase family protein [Rhodospirillales bacterium]|nr:hydantoinase/oxoprolinase family protein [Rhodospirillales bacterium]MDH3791934.1 hydantoinase/oxoprolinase family protein [Rhodospirillales bacterium]MDH3918964.1 hydantoinase/oxoprolinase family protein [Rhodospirillales bacterium]MDH3965483.1 hydantoinase/oxoprolinase family protein [Rhodospirillales bacterium]
MTTLLGIDTGGTYTDAVLFDPAAGVLGSAKALTTKHDLALGVQGAMDAVLPDDPAGIALVSLSTTLATNALVEGHGSPVCLLLIGSGPEALERAGLGRALGGDPVAFIAGGHGAGGDEQRPVDLEAARTAILEYAPKVAAFAVAGYFGVRNPAHEAALRDLVRAETSLPVTCAHELTSNLDAPRRAMTTVLNARLIPLLQQLVLAVRGLLAARGIEAPLMVVKGDGSLIAAEAALLRPIETILSGPAASVMGARALAGAEDVLVADIGGTTTDVALLRDGFPALDRDGADVGGWRTMVEAAAVHTVGIGGDSEVRLDGTGALTVGPRRALPLSLLARDRPEVLEELRCQAARTAPEVEDGRFALRLRPLDAAESSLSSGEAQVWQALAGGPVPLAGLLADHHLARPLARLVDRGLAILAAFTPSDAAHVLGLQDDWSAEAARLGAEIWGRRLAAGGDAGPVEAAAISRRIVEQVIVQSGEALVSAVLAEERGAVLESGRDLARELIARALAGDNPPGGLLDVSLRLRRPLVAIGAPAATYYPAIGERLGTRVTVPPHAGVANAVGAVASGILQTVKALITAPDEGRYRVHLSSEPRDFTAYEEALGFAEREAARLAAEQARQAGAGEVQLRTRRRERIVQGADGHSQFIDCEVAATAVGRPRLAGAPAATESHPLIQAGGAGP